MANVKRPEDFKFEDNKLVLTIEAQGKEDGDTIKSKISAEVRCDSEFAYSVLNNFFDKDPEMESLFKEVIAERSMRRLFSDDEDMKKVIESLSEALKEEKD